MQSIIKKSRVPIKLWAPIEEVESGALDQLLNTANLPCVFKHVAVMPDVHYGIGATVGSVVATKGAIIPAAVGVDIGCGMMAAQLPFTADVSPILSSHSLTRSAGLCPWDKRCTRVLPRKGDVGIGGQGFMLYLRRSNRIGNGWPANWARSVGAITSSKCVWTWTMAFG